MVDQVRRYLQIVPPIDFSTPGASGAQPLEDPDPNNNAIIQCINDGIDYINRIVRIGLNTGISLATAGPGVGGVTIFTRGPFYFDTSGVLPVTQSAFEYTDIVWTDGVNANRLAPLDFYAQEKDYTQWQQLPPGRPTYYIELGNQIGLIPAPNVAGTLIMNGLMTIPQLVNLTDTISYLPIEYQDTVLFAAVVLLSQRQAMDVEAATRAQSFLPLMQQGVVAIYSWANGFANTGNATAMSTLQMIPLQMHPLDLSQPAPSGGNNQ
jgi:hypothetical protein